MGTRPAGAPGIIRRVLFLSLVLVALVISNGCMDPMIIRVADRKEVKAPELIGEIKGADIIFIGELHDNRLHHRAQLELIKALREDGTDIAIGVEMFRTENQDVLDRWVRGEMSEDEFRPVYEKEWGIPWEQYKDIFVYARGNRVPMVALNISRKLMFQVLTKGFSSLSTEQLAGLPPGIECKVDETYEKFMKDALEEHDMEGVTFKSFCEAQMVWDNVMAHNAIEYLKARPGKKMAVLAGGGHSWKRGIPAQVSRLSGYTSVVLLPEPESLDLDEVGPDDADYIIAGRLF
ncbi:MAG TPA: hypothetical protein DDW94_09195 [Deltaproteobacteria bacterium]|nr:MAG: hypothetical protein A2Z79_03700 [Deltaproteobacteria bacterium GWA2_55_82]OGQ63650.1 MAG: hypothetical protein A3I81_02800 [Deltaproteobacteria bacterium RIFCSPLOWO2_02_FULL_55_12]OIJ74488.1 MAG: hypothetical protein A2V21_309600 [Deltaproteobacteria bacterium GWC2_55_46]HBG47146.1 hypothetical protein [Deltaproteobacteria bacterium]HCY10793.1 hypothetical protein [Deltaproteobacteria bacterium]